MKRIHKSVAEEGDSSRVESSRVDSNGAELG